MSRRFKGPIEQVFLAAVTSAALLGGGATAAEKPVTIIIAGNYWDGVADAPLGPAEILVSDGRITEVARKVARPAGSRVVDLSTQFVMPGFIDCHVHLTANANVIKHFPTLNDAALTIVGVNAARTLLHNGFTTVRDVGDFSMVSWITPVLKAAVESGDITGPRIVSGGHLLSAVGGHFDFGGIFRNGFTLEQLSVVEGVAGLRRAVHDEVRHGADWIKYAGSGGFLSPSDGPEDISYSQEENDAIVAAAQGLGKPVAVHAYGDKAVKMAATAGVRSIEHGSLASVEALNLLESKSIYLVPTQFAVVRGARDTCAGRLDPNESAWSRAKSIKYCGAILAAAKNVAASKVKIALGTDLGSFDYSTNGAVEFSEMVTNGIASVRALKAGTSVAAEMLGLDTGVIAPGRLADIVAMPGNPFEVISATEKVGFVMKEGVVYRDDR